MPRPDDQTDSWQERIAGLRSRVAAKLGRGTPPALTKGLQIALAFAGFSVAIVLPVVNLCMNLQDSQDKRALIKVQTDQFLSEAWDLIGGKEGATYLISSEDYCYGEEQLLLARRAINSALSLNDDNAEAHYLVGLYHDANGQQDNALDSFHKALEIDETLIGALCGIAGIKIESGDLDVAKEFATQAVAQEPDNLCARMTWARIYRAEGRVDQEMAEYRKASAIDPRLFAPHLNLGVLLMKQGRPKEAIAEYRWAVELDPSSALAHASLGGALVKLGESDEGEREIRKAVELEPNSAFAQYKLAGILQKRSPEEALHHAELAVSACPIWPGGHVQAAVALLSLGQLEEARYSINRALESDPEYADAHHQHAILLLRQRKLEEAVEAARTACELEPNEGGHCDTLGNALLLRASGRALPGTGEGGVTSYRLPRDQIVLTPEELEEMIDAHHQAVRSEPENASFRLNFGNALSMAGEWQGAIYNYEKGLELDPSSRGLRFSLARARVEAGEGAAVEGELRELVAADPADSDARIILASVLAATGRTPEAELELHKVLDLHPENAEAQQMLADLRAQRAKAPN